jgi:3',5'-cyclic AMP phosphodiesterase CpdA
VISVLHVSDLHFGRPSVPEQVEAIEQLIRTERFDVVAVSGDISQRARAKELRRGRVFLDDAAKASKTIVVPGNHDVKWWRDPVGLGSRTSSFAAYRQFIAEDLEPVLQVPGATFVGLNTAHGVQPHTLTWNPRDIGVVGDLRDDQIARARAAFDAAPRGDARAIVMHHNLVRGDLSRRHGLAQPRRATSGIAALSVDLILCGHDHQEAVHLIPNTGKGTVVSTAGTVSSRSRGHRPSSINMITIAPAEIVVHVRIWNPSSRSFPDGPVHKFAR